MLENDTKGKYAISQGGMVATAFPDATEAGVELLKQGGIATTNEPEHIAYSPGVDVDIHKLIPVD